MALGFDPTKTLDELEGVVWGLPVFPSYLVRTCHRLRRLPLAEFSVEDLRIMIGQQISLPFLVPAAIERLAADPFAAGHLYAGDLLENLLRVPREFWLDHPEPASRVRRIALDAAAALAGPEHGDACDDVPDHVAVALATFLHPSAR